MAEAAELQPHISFDFPVDRPILRLVDVEFEQPEQPSDTLLTLTVPHLELIPDIVEKPESVSEPDSDVETIPVQMPKRVTASVGILRTSDRLPRDRYRRRGGGGGSWRNRNRSCSNCSSQKADISSLSRPSGCQNCGNHAGGKSSSKSEHDS